MSEDAGSHSTREDRASQESLGVIKYDIAWACFLASHQLGEYRPATRSITLPKSDKVSPKALQRWRPYVNHISRRPVRSSSTQVQVDVDHFVEQKPSNSTVTILASGASLPASAFTKSKYVVGSPSRGVVWLLPEASRRCR